MTNNLETKKNTYHKRYIQELLDHSSSKTTEIYTHITKKGLDNLANLEKL